MYDSIGRAYNVIIGRHKTIKVVDSILPDTSTFDGPKGITLEGGYDGDFISLLSSTTIIGSITISNGNVELANIIIQ